MVDCVFVIIVFTVWIGNMLDASRAAESGLAPNEKIRDWTRITQSGIYYKIC